MYKSVINGDMLTNTIIIIFSSILSIIQAQTILVRDRQNHMPLVDVNIFIGQKGITTNTIGACSLDNFNKNDLVTFSLIGYKTLILKKTEIPDILYMENISIPLDLINVYGGKKKYRKNYSKLERDVRKVYPYVRTISLLMEEYDEIIDSLDYYSAYKKFYKKRKIFQAIENELLSKYEFSIRKLTKNQGRILIRLVDRQTDRTSYNIIKNFRNIISASFWQITARVFGHNLKSTYNPQQGEDRLIEYIINMMEK